MSNFDLPRTMCIAKGWYVTPHGQDSLVPTNLTGRVCTCRALEDYWGPFPSEEEALTCIDRLLVRYGSAREAIRS